MSKHIKRAITISIIIILIIVTIISTFFIIKYFKEQKVIDNVKEVYINNNVQEELNKDDNNIETKELTIQVDGETALGVIRIDKIGFEGLVYEGTTLDTLEKGVGHFENSSYINGNVCLAAHNTNKFWAKLHTLQNGDKITYTSFLGTKQYEVNNVTQISETDWSKLSNTKENMLTLITCVKGNKTQRLCVQALEDN